MATLTPKITVAEMTTYGSQNDYRGHEKRPGKGPHGSQNDYRKARNGQFTVAATATQIGYQGGFRLLGSFLPGFLPLSRSRGLTSTLACAGREATTSGAA